MILRGRSSKDMIAIIKYNGWILKDVAGDHHQYIHPTKPGKITIPHPKKDLPIKTVQSILKQAGLL